MIRMSAGYTYGRVTQGECEFCASARGPREYIPCAAMSETSLNCRKMSVINATGRWVHFCWRIAANFSDC